MCSLASTKGPSLVTTSPPSDRTTVAMSAGSRPPPNTHRPAAWTSVLKASTSSNACCISSGDGIGSPSTMCTLSRYCFMGVPPRGRAGTVPTSTPSTNGGAPDRQLDEEDPDELRLAADPGQEGGLLVGRSEEHTSELQSRQDLV